MSGPDPELTRVSYLAHLSPKAGDRFDLVNNYPDKVVVVTIEVDSVEEGGDCLVRVLRAFVYLPVTEPEERHAVH